MKTKIILILSFLFFTLNLLSQERYKIEYDYNTEKIVYYHIDKNNKVDDTLSKPKIKRNSIIELKLKNINPFAVDVITDVKEENLSQSGQGFNFSSLLGGINSFTGDKMDLNVDNLPDSQVFKGNEGARGSNVSNNFSELNNTIANISALKTSMVSNLLNPNLDKTTIMNNLVKNASIQEDARLPDPNENLYLYLSQLEKIVAEDKSTIASDLNAMSNDLEKTENLTETVSRGELVARNIALRDIELLKTSLNNSTLLSIQNLSELKSLLTMLEAASFERTYDYQLEADKVNIELKFIQSDFSADIENENEPNTLKTRNIKLFATGGFKINTSVAFTLNNFGSKSKDYFVDEFGVIGADANDYFVPNLSTMINFYPFMGENFNIGGSFGLSIPISGDENIKGVNFLLGPSLFFGSKSRLALSGGIAYGPVQKLTNGLEIGDTTSFGSIDNFTKNVYEFGYYFGISFSLFDIN